MITEEMMKEAMESSNFIASQPRLQVEKFAYVNAKNQVLSKDDKSLSEDSMKEELLKSNINKSWSNGPRDFYENTKNSETVQNFFHRHNLKTSGDYRKEFLGHDQHQVSIANDASYRAMILTHKKEKLEATPETIPLITKLHEFESSYLDYREKSDLHQYRNLQEQSDAYQKVKENYKSYKSQAMGYENKKVLEDNKVVTHDEAQKRMLNVKQKFTQGKGKSMSM